MSALLMASASAFAQNETTNDNDSIFKDESL